MPNQDDGENPRIAAAIPSNQKTALEYVAQDRSNPGNRTYVADVVRDGIEEWLSHHTDELPEEAKDLLDEDLVANAGEDQFDETKDGGAEA